MEWQVDTSDGVQAATSTQRPSETTTPLQSLINSLHGYDSWNLGAETVSIATVSCKGCIDGVKKESM